MVGKTIRGKSSSLANKFMPQKKKVVKNFLGLVGKNLRGNRTEGRPRIRWATFRPTNRRKVARLQHLFLGGRPSIRG